MADNREISIDPFSDILRFTNAQTVVSGGFSAAGAWAIRFPAPDKIKFFALVKGNCWLRLDGRGGGDVAHHLCPAFQEYGRCTPAGLPDPVAHAPGAAGAQGR